MDAPAYGDILIVIDLKFIYKNNLINTITSTKTPLPSADLRTGDYLNNEATLVLINNNRKCFTISQK
jgi:hypothetical protein